MSMNTILVEAAKAASDADAASRLQELKRWGRAIGVSRSLLVSRSVLQKLVEQGAYTPTQSEADFVPDRDVPERLIPPYLYGDTIHWNLKRGHVDLLEARAQSQAEDAQFQIQFLNAAIGLSHLYLGYAVLTQHVTSL